MLYSKSFLKTIRETPKGANSVNQALLERGAFVSQVGSGIFAYLPLGYRVYEKIRRIIVDHLEKIGVQEVSLPLLNPASLWEKTGRLSEIGEELIKIKTGKDDEFVLAMTHEEVVTAVAAKYIQTYQDLPVILGQISKKIRNEFRPRGGLIRLKEFNMQDAYSFHADQGSLDQTFDSFIKAYEEIFKTIGLKPVVVEAAAGMMGGGDSREFMLISEAGEDKVLVCPKCQRAWNSELAPQGGICSFDKETLQEQKAIELAHIFKLGTKYSESLDLQFTDVQGQKKPVLMGCYGIGLDRLMAAVVESCHDEAGIIWPKTIAPFKVYLIDLEKSQGEKVYHELQESGFSVLFDDRDVSAGVKFADADLLGIPLRLVISQKSLAEGKVEIKERDQKESRLIDIDKICEQLENDKK